MATTRAAPPPSISAIGRRRLVLGSPRPPQPTRAEPRPRGPQPAPARRTAAAQRRAEARRRAETTREPAAGTARLSVARTKAAPAAASPTRTIHDRSLEKMTCSYFVPVRIRIATDAGQFDGVSVISPKTSQQTPDCGIEIEDRPPTQPSGITLCRRKKGATSHAATVRNDSNLLFEIVLKQNA